MAPNRFQRVARGTGGAGGGAASDASGVILGFLVWVWVILPYLNGGTAQTKAVLAAKFLNQTSGQGKTAKPTSVKPATPAGPDFGVGS